MTAKYRLSTGDREFFQLVLQTARANPFMEERRQFNMQLSGLAAGINASEHNKKGVNTVRERFRRLETAGRDNFSQYVTEDELLLKKAAIFDFFHCFNAHFDRHIADQLQAGAKPVKVPFRDEAFAYLHRKGYRSQGLQR